MMVIAMVGTFARVREVGGESQARNGFCTWGASPLFGRNILMSNLFTGKQAKKRNAAWKDV